MVNENRYRKDIKTKEKKTKTVGFSWGLMALASVFIFNPNVGVLDVLPDFFGYIILSVALLKVSMLCEGLSDARRALEKMIIIDGGKLLSVVWIFGVNSTNDRTSSVLLWSFVFAVLEMIFALPAFMKMFDGLSELGNFHENTAIHSSKQKGGASYTDRIKRFTAIFLILKAGMTVLPELTALGTSVYSEGYALSNLYRYIGVIRGICMIPVILVGIVWLTKTVGYFLRIKADKALHNSLSKAYCERIAPRQGLFTIRNVRAATWFMIAASVLTLDIKLEGINIMPDVLVLVFLAISLVYFCKTTRLSVKLPVVMMALFGAAAIFAPLAEGYFLENYTYNAIEKSSQALAAYLVYVGAVALQGILLVCMLASVFKSVQKVISEHTGYVLGKEIESEGEKARIKEVQGELYKSFTRIIDVAIIYVLSDVLYSLYGAFYAFMDTNAGYLSLINIACGILFVGMSVKAVDELREAVQTKYMLE